VIVTLFRAITLPLIIINKTRHAFLRCVNSFEVGQFGVKARLLCDGKLAPRRVIGS
jgi:hypothetical protein